MDVKQAMAVGASRYDDILQLLRSAGYRPEFTQTGGMCAAIQVTLERGLLLVTDASEELPWDRAELQGWGVGYYREDDVSEGPLAYAEHGDPSPERLLAAISECLESAASLHRGA